MRRWPAVLGTVIVSAPEVVFQSDVLERTTGPRRRAGHGSFVPGLKSLGWRPGRAWP